LKYLITFTFLVTNSFLSFGQSRVEAFVTPGFGFRHMITQPGISSDIKDSINNMDKVRVNWGGGIKFLIGIDKYSGIQLGVNYKGLSYTRMKEDLQFNDTIHPSLGRVLDISQTINSKDAYFYNRYRYMSIPVAYQRTFTRKKINGKMRFYMSPGISFDFLMNDKVSVATPGWSVAGDDRHTIATDYESTSFNVSLNLGARYELKLDEYATLSVQPHFDYPLLRSAQDALVEYRLYQFAVSVGVSYLL